MITKKIRDERKIMKQKFDRQRQKKRKRVKKDKSESKGEIRF